MKSLGPTAARGLSARLAVLAVFSAQGCASESTVYERARFFLVAASHHDRSAGAEALDALRGDPSWKVAALAAQAAVAAGVSDQEVAAAGQTRPEWEVRAHVVRALGMRASSAALSVVARAAERDRDFRVRSEALAVLRRQARHEVEAWALLHSLVRSGIPGIAVAARSFIAAASTACAAENVPAASCSLSGAVGAWDRLRPRAQLAAVLREREHAAQLLALRERSSEQAWDQAVAAGDLGQIDAFLREHPATQHAAEGAQLRHRWLSERALAPGASVGDIRAYLSAFPDGVSAPDLRARLDEIAGLRWRDLASGGNANEIRSFVDEFAGTAAAAESRAWLAGHEEEMEWRGMRDSLEDIDPPLLEAFLERFPGSPHAGAVRRVLDRRRQEEVSAQAVRAIRVLRNILEASRALEVLLPCPVTGSEFTDRRCREQRAGDRAIVLGQILVGETQLRIGTFDFSRTRFPVVVEANLRAGGEFDFATPSPMRTHGGDTIESFYPADWTAGRAFIDFENADDAEAWRQGAGERVKAWLFFRVAGTWTIRVPPDVGAAEPMIFSIRRDAVALNAAFNQATPSGPVVRGIRIRPLAWFIVDGPLGSGDILGASSAGSGGRDRATVEAAMAAIRDGQWPGP